MFWLVALGVLFGVVVWKLLQRDENPLDQLPGPDRKPIIGCALEFARIDSQKLFLLVRQYFKKYGERFVVKIFSRRILHICDPKDIEVVLSHSKNITKSLPYTFLQPWLGTGLLLSTGAKWHVRRKILTPTFHFNILKNFSIIMEEKSRDLVDKLRSTSGADVDIMSEISDFTLFTICETAMGTQLDKDQSSKTVEYKSAIQNIGQLMMSRLTNVWLHNDFIFSLSSQGKRYNECLRKVHDFADNVIAERRKQRGANTKEFTAALEGEHMGAKRRLAMMDLLLEAEDKGEIDVEGIREEVNTFMFEGYDTTAMALTFTLMLLAEHEDVQGSVVLQRTLIYVRPGRLSDFIAFEVMDNRILEECQSIFGDSQRAPTQADWAEMKYMDAVIKEGLRMYPSVPFVARLITEDFVMGDLLVKAGTEVAVHIYDLHRRSDLFPEPEQFRPERFLVKDSRPPYAYVPFSAGLRNCIGQKFALMEMKCVLSSICRTFRLQPTVRGDRPKLGADLVIRPVRPVYIRFLPR